jgi:phage tail protein X
VHYAKEMLATPATPLHEWARFSLAAASALLDADADLAEVEQFLRGAQATMTMVELPGEAGRLRVLEARFALASGDCAGALELTRQDHAGLPDGDMIRMRATEGRALVRLERVDEAIVALRAAAGLCERLEMFKHATAIWREIDDLHSPA